MFRKMNSASYLITCYVAGIPFFGTTLASDACFAFLLFGGFAFVERLRPALRESQPSALPGYGG